MEMCNPLPCIISEFLLDAVCIHCKYLFVTLHPFSFIYAIPCFMLLSPDFLRYATYKYSWDTTSNVPYLTLIPTYIYLITKRYSLLTNQGELAAQVTEALTMDLDRRTIGGG